MRPNFHSFRSRQPQAWRSPEVEKAVSERRKAFTAAHRSDKDRLAYSASRHASSVIAKAKAEAWQATCSSRLNLCILSSGLSLAVLFF